MNRNVRQIFYKPREGDASSPRPFKDFQTARNVILLGDPGAGKTHVFRDAAATEGGRFITARAFLTTPARLLTQETFYIDGLDERRAGRGDRDTVDKLVEKLFEVSPAKVRISCRVADWLGESDLAAINPFFDQSETATVVVLEKLSPREQRAVLEALGMNAKQADAFCKQADERGLTDFLENPQNLTMLWRAVQTGKWPDTRKQLFELATELMLGEFDKEHARKGLGTYTVKELRSVAGAICAAWLISDIEAISLTDQEGTKETPGYRSLTLAEAEKVQAALGRRVFIAAALEPETVDYAHRTTAEFLGAEWLAQKVRNGLPIGRLQALMGVDGQPASELRGLHAWLAVHLPTHAKALIEADPYGVLTYGDAAALSTPACAHLVHSLGKLSKVNPWFRSGGQASPSIGALARKDMVPEFQKVLRSPTVGFGIRSVVVDALSIGAPLPEMKKDLVTGVQSNNWPYRDRAVAMNTLLRLGQDGKDAVVQIFRSGLGASENDYRLRTIILERLYGDPFGVADVVELINSFLNVKANRGSAMEFIGKIAPRRPPSHS